jgi:transposase
MQIRKQHNKQTKFNAAIDLVKNDKTLLELSQKYGVCQSRLQRWKKALMEGGPGIFEDQRKKKTPAEGMEALERKIGQLTMEVDFLKKALGQ